MENIIYKITDRNNNVRKVDKHTLKESIDTIIDDISELKKSYMLNGKRYGLFLFSVEHDFTANEYIEHYQSLPIEYGKPLLSEFDMSLIRKLNY